jgi:hypothetical protein
MTWQIKSTGEHDLGEPIGTRTSSPWISTKQDEGGRNNTLDSTRYQESNRMANERLRPDVSASSA